MKKETKKHEHRWLVANRVLTWKGTTIVKLFCTKGKCKKIQIREID